MWNGLKIREDLSASDLRALACKEGNRRTAMRMLAIADACCTAWNALTSNREALRSLTAFPWLPQVIS